jgi:hypothetical protein
MVGTPFFGMIVTISSSRSKEHAALLFQWEISKRPMGRNEERGIYYYVLAVAH